MEAEAIPIGGVPRAEPFPGWAFFPIGAGLLAFGAALVLVGRRDIDLTQGIPMEAAMAAFARFGALLSLGGLYVLARAALWLRGALRARRGSRERPGEPWLWDFPWDPRGSRGEAARRAAESGGKAVVALPLAGLYTFYMASWILPGEARDMALDAVSLAAVVFVDAVALYWAYEAFRDFASLSRQGKGALVYGAFPFRAGSVLEARLPKARAAEPLRWSAAVRCVQERIEYLRLSRGRRYKYIRRYQILSVEAGEPRSQGEELLVRVALPEGPATRLSARLPLYWELVLRGEGAGGFVTESVFLVPVY